MKQYLRKLRFSAFHVAVPEPKDGERWTSSCTEWQLLASVYWLIPLDCVFWMCHPCSSWQTLIRSTQIAMKIPSKNCLHCSLKIKKRDWIPISFLNRPGTCTLTRNYGRVSFMHLRTVCNAMATVLWSWISPTSCVSAKRTKIKKKADQVVGGDDQGEDQEEKVSYKPEICENEL